MREVIVVVLVWTLGILLPGRVEARVPMGIHVLDVSEVGRAAEMFEREDEEWGFVTIPIRMDQLNQEKWQEFFDKAYEEKVIPLVRLISEFDADRGVWKKPTRKDVVEMADFLSSLEWHTNKRRVIVYNEPNHGGEWGGEIDPEGYGRLLSFAADWFHTEGVEYEVLPAGMDAAAGNTAKTMESNLFLRRMAAANPEVVDKIDAWTSHSYPNPGFSASAYGKGKSSVSGWRSELDFVERNWERSLDVYITETGWDQSKVSYERLVGYYEHSLEEVWDDERVKGVTPFVLNGFNGLFDGFSFSYPDGSPTPQLEALVEARERVREG